MSLSITIRNNLRSIELILKRIFLKDQRTRQLWFPSNIKLSSLLKTKTIKMPIIYNKRPLIWKRRSLISLLSKETRKSIISLNRKLIFTRTSIILFVKEFLTVLMNLSYKEEKNMIDYFWSIII